MRAVQRLFDLRDAFLGGRAADLGPRTRAQPLGDLRPQLDTPFGRRGVERLRVGVGDDDIDALEARRDHVFDGIAASAGDAAALKGSGWGRYVSCTYDLGGSRII